MTFEQRAAELIRTLTIWNAALSVALALALGLAGWGFIKASNDQAALKIDQVALRKSVQSPTHGKDIAIWCNAINADRTYNKTFVRKVTRGQVPYGLNDLNCAQIEAGEAASTKTKH